MKKTKPIMNYQWINLKTQDYQDTQLLEEKLSIQHMKQILNRRNMKQYWKTLSTKTQKYTKTNKENDDNTQTDIQANFRKDKNQLTVNDTHSNINFKFISRSISSELS